ncbi:serine hydrolase [Fluviicola taffensis]|uniref:Beta-lactamase n=1 Tax=Fluviicola taffensis (strain DSM 16823 / NCIMB 13979 / RW262) TaxID=755732 RepID=F2IHR2_FLUTR|nr:serine hydrolase [Fluviicola taffensis]AEA44840.1 beta-lactamase [Fluviicola taffensis DSM 16823]
MKLSLLLLALILGFSNLKAQTYFPPLVGNTWSTTDPATLGWCPDSITKMYDWLELSDSKAFIVLKDGKIVLEKYFGTFTIDSFYVWNSAGKTLTAYAVGIAQHEGFLDINDPTIDYLGTGWTSLTPTQEAAITIKHQLTMTTGLDDGVSDIHCTDPSCLIYKAAPGTRWAYHNGPYTLLDSVIESATGLTLNAWVNQKISSKIGMVGTYLQLGYNNVFASKARGMARFGLLLSQDGYWNANPVLPDLTYLNAMRNSSQSLNNSYGYLTWLNGKASFMLPQSQFVFSGELCPNAPTDMYAAEGKNGQIINVVPSQGLVVVRMGANMGTSLVGTQYNDTIWQYMNRLSCTLGTTENSIEEIQLSPNPSTGTFTISDLTGIEKMEVSNQLGQIVTFQQVEKEITLNTAQAGVYFLTIHTKNNTKTFRVMRY